jgi:hypothetical protein
MVEPEELERSIRGQTSLGEWIGSIHTKDSRPTRIFMFLMQLGLEM